jgi:hypothetical protein
MLSGGGTAAAEQAFGTGLANQAYNQYTTNLAPFGNQAVTSAYGQGNMDAALGNQLGTSFQGQGTAANNAQQGIGNAQAAADLNNYNVSQAGLGTIFGGLGSILGTNPNSGTIGGSLAKSILGFL